MLKTKKIKYNGYDFLLWDNSSCIFMDNNSRCKFFEENKIFNNDGVYYMIRQIETKVLNIVNKKTV